MRERRRIDRLDVQYLRAHLLPDRHHFVEPVQQRARHLVRRIGQQVVEAVVAASRPVRGEKRGAARVEPRIGLDQARRHVVEGRIRPQRGRLAQLVQPAAQPARRLFGAGRREPEPFEVDHPAHAFRPGAGVQAHDVRTHAVSDQVDLAGRRVAVDERIEITEVFVEPVVAAALPRDRPVGQPEAARIGRDHLPVARERIDDELERRRDVHPAVQHEQRRRIGPAPAPHMQLDAAHRDEIGNRTRGTHRSRQKKNGRSIIAAAPRFRRPAIEVPL